MPARPVRRLSGLPWSNGLRSNTWPEPALTRLGSAGRRVLKIEAGAEKHAGLRQYRGHRAVYGQLARPDILRAVPWRPSGCVRLAAGPPGRYPQLAHGIPEA